MAAIELPTIALAFTIYAGWVAITWFWHQLPAPLLVILGGWLLAWHGSLQHETIHQHPTRLSWLNKAVGFPPLALWLPYELYRRSHLRHHRDPYLTDPIEDPESAYLTAGAWLKFGRIGRNLHRARLTLSGRMLLSPVMMVVEFWHEELGLLAIGDRDRQVLWLRHFLGVGMILGWVVLICRMPPWIYITAVVYPGLALTQIRAFGEHRWASDPAHRTAIVEAPVLGLLFLHNNLHALHHASPHLPWYRLPSLYRLTRDDLVRRNGGFFYRGYGDVARRYLWQPHDAPVHPRHASL